MPGVTGSNTTKVAKSCNVAKSPAELAQLAEQAVAQAAAEGLTLHRSSKSKTGFKSVTRKECVLKTDQYQARTVRGSKTYSLGCFDTAEEAALCYARSLL